MLPTLALVALVTGCAPAASPPATPNILLVSLDTVRADRLGVLGNPRGLTPNLDAFAAESVVFEQAYAQANMTAMSHASLFTSRYPSELGVCGPRFHMSAEASTLPQVLSVYGYESAAFTGGGHLDRGWGLERGFDPFQAAAQMGSFWHTLPRAFGWLDHRKSTAPFMLFVHTYDAHAPYLDPAPYGLAWTDPDTAGSWRNAIFSQVGTERIFDHTFFGDTAMIAFVHRGDRPRTWDEQARAAIAAEAARPERKAEPFTAADAAQVSSVYDGAVAYADAGFGRLIEGLKARGLYDDLIVVVFGDHGESLGEDGRFGHGDALNDAQLHVPLIVKLPGAKPHHVAQPVALLDVMPTLVAVVNGTSPAEARGISLLPALLGTAPLPSRTLFAESNERAVSARSASGRLTFAGIDAHSPYLSALLASASITGPAFAVNTTVEPTAREALRGELEAWRAGLAPAGPLIPTDPTAVDAMRKQGYWAP